MGTEPWRLRSAPREVLQEFYSPPNQVRHRAARCCTGKFINTIVVTKERSTYVYLLIYIFSMWLLTTEEQIVLHMFDCVHSKLIKIN